MAGLVEAIAANLPGAAWQRCRTHYAANLMGATPKTMWPAVKAMLHSVYDQPDAVAVHAQFDRLLDLVKGVGADLASGVGDEVEAALGEDVEDPSKERLMEFASRGMNGSRVVLEGNSCMVGGSSQVA